MGTLPVLSILKGPTRPLFKSKHEPVLLHKIFEHTVSRLGNNNNNNSNEDNLNDESIHGITLDESTLFDKTAIIHQKQKTSYQKLNENANQLARSILKEIAGQGCNPDGDNIIAVCLPPSDALICTLLAIWKVGAAYLPIDSSFPVGRIQHILNESEPLLVIAENDDHEGFKGYKAVSYNKLKATSDNYDNHDIDELESLHTGTKQEQQLAIILYTSGSTGIPKGVRLPHAVVLNRIKWQWQTFPYSKTEEICVFKTALTFVDSVSEMWGPLLHGRTVLVISKEDTKNPEQLISILDDHKVERLVLVPSLLRSILLYLGMVNNDGTFHREPQKSIRNKLLQNLRLWVCSGEPLPVSLAKKFYQFFSSESHILCNFYGSTEIMGDVTYHAIKNFEEIAFEEQVPIGKPMDNTIIYILDKQFRPVKKGDVGELYVSGLNLAAGYVRGRDPDKFIDNPLAVDPSHLKLYRTGDFAKIKKNVVYYEGRTDSQIKVRGHKVDIVEVEAAVTKVEQVDKCVVLCYKVGEVDQALLSFVTVNSPDTTTKLIEEKLEKTLAPYMVPQVIIVSSIPLLVNGKVDRQFLLRKYEEQYKDDVQNDKTELEYTGISDSKLEAAKALFETVASVLGRSLRGKISPESNFYQLGGNSLNSVYTVTKLRDMGYVIGIGDFISASCMSDIINRMRTEDCSTYETIDSVSSVPLHKYTTEMLRADHKIDAYGMITSSFYEKADLEQWLMPDISRSDYSELMDAIWGPLVDKNFSFVVRGTDGEIKGVGLNFDAHDEPVVEIHSKLVIVFEFLEYIEGPIRDNQLPKGKGQILHSFMMATRDTMTAQENIEVFQYMEQEVLRIARDNGFAGILTTNTSPLTQQLGADVYNYKVLLDYQVNRYVASDGSKPFGKAPDSQRAMVSWTTI